MIDKSYELKSLTSEEVFPMSAILSKIGFKEFRSCFESDEVKKALSGGNFDANSIGMMVTFEIAGVIVSNLPKAKEDIYSLLSHLSGMTKKEIAELPIAEFMQMIVDVVQKEEFKDFFMVVSKLFK